MPYPYVTAEELRHRLSRAVYDRLLDDDGDGEADATAADGDETSPVDSLIRDASAKVAGVLRGIYDLDAIEALTAEELPSEIKRLTLDVAVSYAAQRHPEVVRHDWVPLMKQADADLMNLRNGKTRLDVVGSPEPAENQGGEALSGNPDDTTPIPRFSDNWGSF